MNATTQFPNLSRVAQAGVFRRQPQSTEEKQVVRQAADKLPAFDEVPGETVIQPAADVKNLGYTVVYHPGSTDSVYATGLLLAALGPRVKEVIPFNFLDDVDPLLGKDHLLVVGVELQKEALDALYDQGKGGVTLLAYRDSYAWLTKKAHAMADSEEGRKYLEKWGQRLALLAANDRQWIALSTNVFQIDNANPDASNGYVHKGFFGRLKDLLGLGKGKVVRDANSVELHATSPLTNRTDNTAIALARRWLTHTNRISISGQMENPNESWLMLQGHAIAAMRLCSMAFPITHDNTPLGDVASMVEGSPSGKWIRTPKGEKPMLQDWQETELVHKATLHSIVSQLRQVLRSPKPLVRLQEVVATGDTQAYMEHWSMTGDAYRRGTGEHHFRHRLKVMRAPTIACTEAVHSDILTQVAPNLELLMTYEDVKGFRIWRAYAQNREVRNALICAVKGQAIWCEGNYVCSYVKAPELVSK